MPTIAIVGAGPLLGLSIAKIFGKHGFKAALISRNEQKLATLVAQLKDLKIESAAFPADVREPAQLEEAFRKIKAKFGDIDVLEYSPTEWGDGKFYPALETTPAVALNHFKLLVLGAIVSVEQVLPEMMKRQSGAIFFSTGTSAHGPLPFITSLGISNAGLRNYALCLHEELADKHVYVGTVSIGVQIAHGAGKGDPDSIAEVYYEMYEKRDRKEDIVQ
jgi:short-subunit dehydrogenase